MKTLRIAILPLTAVALVAAGCGGGGSGSLGSGDVAKVGSTTITRADFDKLMAQAATAYKAQHQKFPPQTSTQYQGLKDQAVQFLVQRAEYQQVAKQMGVSVTPKQISDRLVQIAKTYYGGSTTKMYAQLAKEHVSKATVEGRIQDQLLQQALYDKVTSKVTVSPQEIKAQYQTQYQPTRDVRHILVKSKPLADKLYKQLKADHERNFAQLAKKYSKDPSSASQGGKLTITKGQTVPQFEHTAFTLKTGAMSAPVHTKYGWHIIQALSPVKPAPPFKQVKVAIQQQLLGQKKQQLFQTWVSGLAKKFKPAYQTGFAPAASTQPTLTTTTG
jgi:parvulin-like peptidyl-prolyl isomerase